jgi:hypothetical protein
MLVQGRGGNELAGELARALERSMYPGPSGGLPVWGHSLAAALLVPGSCPAPAHN